MANTKKYKIEVLGDSQSYFEMDLTDEEKATIEKFFEAMSESDVPHYDIPCLWFEEIAS